MNVQEMEKTEKNIMKSVALFLCIFIGAFFLMQMEMMQEYGEVKPGEKVLKKYQVEMQPTIVHSQNSRCSVQKNVGTQVSSTLRELQVSCEDGIVPGATALLLLCTFLLNRWLDILWITQETDGKKREYYAQF